MDIKSSRYNISRHRGAASCCMCTAVAEVVAIEGELFLTEVWYRVTHERFRSNQSSSVYARRVIETDLIAWPTKTSRVHTCPKKAGMNSQRYEYSAYGYKTHFSFKCTHEHQHSSSSMSLQFPTPLTK